MLSKFDEQKLTTGQQNEGKKKTQNHVCPQKQKMSCAPIMRHTKSTQKNLIYGAEPGEKTDKFFYGN